ncbi:MAG: mechanosensitive ion channel family protein [Rikenellaceae bacterium]|nr:mechanosensitive ion channel family protein [Rikenellaceae bacterium]
MEDTIKVITHDSNVIVTTGVDTEIKLGPLQGIEDFFLRAGLSPGVSDTITYLLACGILILIIWLANRFGVTFLSYIFKRTGFKTKSLWIDHLYKRCFFHRSVRIIPTAIALSFSTVLLTGYDSTLIAATRFILQSVVAVMAINIISAFLDAANDVYDDHVKEKSIKGYIQTAKIILWIIAIIVIISMILNIQPSSIIIGIGTSAAIFSLVFRDIILGFIASLQLSAQDMIRRGDWITMPTREADGEIQEITLTTVKVQNWDNTMTMVPIYSMITESFINWRTMRESSGRRFLRQLHIDISSVRIMDEAKLSELGANAELKPVYVNAVQLLANTNTSNFVTNIGLFRCYVEKYLLNHPKINPKPRLTVRYLPQTDNGMILELYAFSHEKLLIEYERTIADILEHIVAVSVLFDLRMFQQPSGRDIVNINK